jgi:hypothetical protein
VVGAFIFVLVTLIDLLDLAGGSVLPTELLIVQDAGMDELVVLGEMLGEERVFFDLMEAEALLWIECKYPHKQIFGVFIAVVRELPVGPLDVLLVGERELGLDVQHLTLWLRI